jgi:serine/threonine protein phosphatase PrpC
MRARFAGKTDVGLQREHNEDNLLVMPKFGVFAVADGMGGHRSGDVASQLAVSTLQDFFNITVRHDATWPFPANPELTDEENYLLTGLRLANRRIFDRSLKTMADFGMGTTIVAAMFGKRAKTIAVAHVGDSRAYRIRNGSIAQLTRDHSLISDAAHMAPWMTQEEVAQLPPNVITRALGIREDVLVDLLSEKTEVGDVYLLCSDGLSGMVTDDDMLTTVVEAEELGAAADKLVEKANMNGGVDNITVMLARVDDGDPQQGDDDYVEDEDADPADSEDEADDEAPSSRKRAGGSTGRTIVEVRLQEELRKSGLSPQPKARALADTSPPGPLPSTEASAPEASGAPAAAATSDAKEAPTKEATGEESAGEDSAGEEAKDKAPAEGEATEKADDAPMDADDDERDSMDADTDPLPSKPPPADDDR